jgi:hypothetical protein
MSMAPSFLSPARIGLALALLLAMPVGCGDDATPSGADTRADATPLSCETAPPGTVVACDAGFPMVCAADSPTPVRGFCPAGEACVDGACGPIEGNVLVIMDTSGSMNWMPGRRIFARQCTTDDCPPWEFPACDDPETPETRIGAAKLALRRFIESDDAGTFRIGLQRFPTIPRGTDEPRCESGYQDSTSPDVGIPAVVTGDTGARTTAEGGWLMRNLAEILVVPLVRTRQRDDLVRWVDWDETTEATADRCVGDADCADRLCIGGVCHRSTNPELRAVGGTPLGKSIFYAGEIFRHRVLVEGRTCNVDPDCNSPHHRCVDGRCTDPLRRCRANAVIVFTDGVESDNLRLDDFFHPRVQAKRLHVGLGCRSTNDCGPGATCEDGRCMLPEDALPWPLATRVCTSGEFPCTTDDACPNACPSQPDGRCAAICATSDVPFDTGGDGDRLVGLDGTPLSLRVHVVDASGRDDTNKLIAAWGGGTHHSVDAADPLAIATALREVIRDLKSSTRCLVPP